MHSSLWWSFNIAEIVGDDIQKNAINDIEQSNNEAIIKDRQSQYTKSTTRATFIVIDHSLYGDPNE